MNAHKKSNDLEMSLLSCAVSKMMVEMGSESDEKYKDDEIMVPDPEYAAEFEKALDKACKLGRLRAFGKKAAKAGKYAVTFCSVLIIILTVSVISVDAFRFRFLEWLIGVHETHNSINISRNDKIYSDVMIADYMPEGYVMVSYNKENTTSTLQYSNGQYNIYIRIYSGDYGLTSDNENLTDEKLYFNDHEAIYQKKGDISKLLWSDGDETYSIQVNDPQIKREEIVKIAQSVN